MAACTILLAGDLHLGRSSSRVAAGDGVDLSARGALGRLVDAAIADRADVLLLSGDVADESNKYWEAIGPLTAAVRRLAAAGIRTVAVAGNHDHDALPRLAERLDPADFRLLGPGGTWERWTLERDGRPALHVDGWSFPRDRWLRSPLHDYPARPDPTVPTLGLVHGDLDVANSPYAPLAAGDLRAQPVLGWLLGHVHAPRIDAPEAAPFLVYPGSPQALDPGETGPHGAVRLRIEEGRVRTLEPVPLSSVRYDTLDLDVSGVSDRTDFDRMLQESLETATRDAAAEGGGVLDRLVLRVRLHGATDLAASIDAELGRIEQDLELQADGVGVVVERMRSELRPALDLVRLARTSTPVGALAAALLELDRAGSDGPLGGDASVLVGEVRRALETVRGDRAYRGVGPVGEDGTPGDDRHPSEAEVRACAREQAGRLLAAITPDAEGDASAAAAGGRPE